MASRNFYICGPVARSSGSSTRLLSATQNRTTRILPNPDNSCAADMTSGERLRPAGLSVILAPRIRESCCFARIDQGHRRDCGPGRRGGDRSCGVSEIRSADRNNASIGDTGGDLRGDRSAFRRRALLLGGHRRSPQGNQELPAAADRNLRANGEESGSSQERPGGQQVGIFFRDSQIPPFGKRRR